MIIKKLFINAFNPNFLFILIIMIIISPTLAYTQPILIRTHTSGTDLLYTDGNFLYYYSNPTDLCTPTGVLHLTTINGKNGRVLDEYCNIGAPELVTDGVNIFFTFTTNLLKLPVTGGTLTSIATGVGTLSLDLDSNYVYWAGRNGVHRTFKSGAGTELLANSDPGAFNLGKITSLAIDNTYVYYLETTALDASDETYAVKRVRKTGGSIQKLYESPASSFLECR